MKRLIAATLLTAALAPAWLGWQSGGLALLQLSGFC